MTIDLTIIPLADLPIALSTLREEQGVTQSHLARSMGRPDKKTVPRMESRDPLGWTIRDVLQYAAGLGLKVDVRLTATESAELPAPKMARALRRHWRSRTEASL